MCLVSYQALCHRSVLRMDPLQGHRNHLQRNRARVHHIRRRPCHRHFQAMAQAWSPVCSLPYSHHYRRARDLRTVHPSFTRQDQAWYLLLDHRRWRQMGHHCCPRDNRHYSHRVVPLVARMRHPRLSLVLAHPMIRPTPPVSRLCRRQVSIRRRTLLQALRSILRMYQARRHQYCPLIVPPLHRALDLRASRRWYRARCNPPSRAACHQGYQRLDQR